MPKLAWGVYSAGLILVGGALRAVLATNPPWMAAADVRRTLVEIGLQVLVFGLIGGAVKLALDRQTEYRAFQSDMLQRLGDAHKDVYRIRRQLSVDPSRTTELLGELMNARQLLGAAYHVARFKGLRRRIALIKRETDGMRTYLEKVIEQGLERDMSPRPLYDDFVDWRHSTRYEAEFKDRYMKAKQLVDPEFVPDRKPVPPANDAVADVVKATE